MPLNIYIYIYIYIERERERERLLLNQRDKSTYFKMNGFANESEFGIVGYLMPHPLFIHIY